MIITKKHKKVLKKSNTKYSRLEMSNTNAQLTLNGVKVSNDRITSSLILTKCLNSPLIH